MWGTFLSEPLRIVGLVVRYTANCLMRRMPIPVRIAPLALRGCPIRALCGIRRNFFRLSHRQGQVAYVLLTRAPVAGGAKQASLPAAPRLACVKPVASVHPEPGSNSPLLVYLFSFFFKIPKDKTSCLVVCLAFAPLRLMPPEPPARSSALT